MGLVQGSFGRVFLGKWRETTVAIKLLSQGMFVGANALDDANGSAMASQRWQRWVVCFKAFPESPADFHVSCSALLEALAPSPVLWFVNCSSEGSLGEQDVYVPGPGQTTMLCTAHPDQGVATVPDRSEGTHECSHRPHQFVTFMHFVGFRGLNSIECHTAGARARRACWRSCARRCG